MSGQTNSSSNPMDTSTQIRHVFGCKGQPFHLTPGFKLLRSGDITKCPECGAEVYDATNTPVGQYYIAFARFDLGERP